MRRLPKIRWPLCVTALIAIAASCTTRPIEFASPTGIEPADILEEFDVLGAVRPSLPGSTSRGYDPDGFPVDHTIDVPVGTELVIPLLQGWYLGYEPFPAAVDHHVGILGAAVYNPTVNPPDLTSDPPTQTAVVSLAHWLYDARHSYESGTRHDVELLCLRRSTNSTVRVPADLLNKLSIGRVQDVDFHGGQEVDTRWIDDSVVALPATTQRTSVLLSGWMSGFGHHDFPSSRSSADGPFGTPDPGLDHHFGMMTMGLSRTAIRPPEPGAPLPAPSVLATGSGRLADKHHAAPFFGAVKGHLIALTPSRDPGERMTIVGLGKRHTQMPSVSDGRTATRESVEVEVPADTEDVLIALRAWSVFFGRQVPPEDESESQYRWYANAHHFGLARVSVHLDSIDPPDSARPAATRTAHLTVSMQLRDRNGDDRWGGWVQYHLIYLARRTP